MRHLHFLTFVFYYKGKEGMCKNRLLKKYTSFLLAYEIFCTKI
ncbi:hypothetical protein ANACAC_00155 [Anaerostipes caccae L1-92]|uniref:Uncharacterized protein n=1 Tax=Anaerostipes caccae (strain DSM 14662 / CCUG 47493 / JCM 13470 / NCIMB 13811 / L1-92) TaxID=411490 RepID=B0M9I6_ANACD|nr:hypothetical protein ANACAC_00155 [Anaerostipes caccae L1-92]